MCLPCKSVRAYVDNQGAIALANNPVHHKRSKHIDVKYHYVRLEIQYGIVELTYVTTDNNVADVFTKPVTRVTLQLITVAHKGHRNLFLLFSRNFQISIFFNVLV